MVVFKIWITVFHNSRSGSFVSVQLLFKQCEEDEGKYFIKEIALKGG